MPSLGASPWEKQGKFFRGVRSTLYPLTSVMWDTRFITTLLAAKSDFQEIRFSLESAYKPGLNRLAQNSGEAIDYELHCDYGQKQTGQAGDYAYTSNP